MRRVFQFIAATFERTQREQREHLAERTGFDWEPAAVLVTAALALTWRHYHYLAPDVWETIQFFTPEFIGGPLRRWVESSDNRELARLANWTFAQTVAFLVAPLLCCALLRKRPQEYALKLSDATAGWRFYLPMYLLILPGLIIASRTQAFQDSYPFYRLDANEPLWPRFIVWELLYAWQFLVLELFFRGFLVHGLKRSCGFYAVFVMAAPYCMIHFGKPAFEAVVSIIAGVAMGVMSLGVRSIWMGAALHIAVAWTMDLLALWMVERG